MNCFVNFFREIFKDLLQNYVTDSLEITQEHILRPLDLNCSPGGAAIFLNFVTIFFLVNLFSSSSSERKYIGKSYE